MATAVQQCEAKRDEPAEPVKVSPSVKWPSAPSGTSAICFAQAWPAWFSLLNHHTLLQNQVRVQSLLTGCHDRVRLLRAFVEIETFDLFDFD